MEADELYEKPGKHHEGPELLEEPEEHLHGEYSRRRKNRLFVLFRQNISIALATGLGFGPFWIVFVVTGGRRERVLRRYRAVIGKYFANVFQESVLGGSETELIDRVGEHARAYAAYDSWRALVLLILTTAKYIVFFAAMASFSTLVLRLYPDTHLDSADLVASRRFALLLLFFLAVPGFLTQSAVMMMALNNSTPATPFLARLFARLSQRWVFLCSAAYLIWLASLQRMALAGVLTSHQVILHRGLLLTIAVIALIGLITAIGRISNYIFGWFMRQHCADSLIVVLLTNATTMSKPPCSVSSDRWRRRELILTLESIASSFESALPSQIVGNGANSSDLKQEFGRIADGVRALKRRIAIPASDTWNEELSVDLSDFLVNFLSLNWAALPLGQIEKKASPTILARLLAVIRFLLVAAIPAILLVALKAANVPLATEHQDLAWLVVAAWFAISVIIRIDPQFSEKTKALKDVHDLVTLKAKPPG